MSFRRKLAILIAAAFIGTCASLYRWNSAGEATVDWVPIDSTQTVSLAQIQRSELPPSKSIDSEVSKQANGAAASAPKPAVHPIQPLEWAELPSLPPLHMNDHVPATNSEHEKTNKSKPELRLAVKSTVDSKKQLPVQKFGPLGKPPQSKSRPVQNPFYKPSTGLKSKQPSNPPVATPPVATPPQDNQETEKKIATPLSRNDLDFIPVKLAANQPSSGRPIGVSKAPVQQASKVSAPSNFENRLAAHSTASVPDAVAPVAANPAAQAVLPEVVQDAQNFVLAAQPQQGARWNDTTPVTDSRAIPIAPIPDDFSPNPTNDCDFYDAHEQQNIYEGKTHNATQRPLLEVGRPWYQLGQLSPPSNRFGKHNPLEQQFIIFGDARTGIASNAQKGNSSTLSASQLNLNFDWKVTSTERFHMFVSPLTQGLDSTGFLFDEDRFLNNTNFKIPFGFFEGDLGAVAGGATNKTYPFDLPFAVGVIPMVFQNGVWMENQILGFAFTIPSRHSARWDISNMDITFFAGYDKLVTDALPGDNGAGKVYGIASFIEACNGYVEADYAFIEDRTFLDRGYHNLGIGYTRRFGRFVSNSTRAILNLGQDPNGISQTADGCLLLSENSLITGAPSNVVPYFNLFAGFDRPQSVARNALAGGVLRNTGILFESDNLTRYPTLDATANETYGAALGLNLLASDFSQQLVVETAFVGTMGPDAGRNAVGNQYGVGARYQLPLTNSLIFRADLMYGFLESTEDSHGARVELRRKF